MKFSFKSQSLAFFWWVYEGGPWQEECEYGPILRFLSIYPSSVYFHPRKYQRRKTKEIDCQEDAREIIEFRSLFLGTISNTQFSEISESIDCKFYSFIWKNFPVFYQKSKKKCQLYVVIQKLPKRTHLILHKMSFRGNISGKLPFAFVTKHLCFLKDQLSGEKGRITVVDF